MRHPDKTFAVIEAQATAWLARCDGGMSMVERAEFDRWCAADPRHAAAVKEIADLWTAFDGPAASGQIESLRAELHALDRRDRRRWMAGGAAAALAGAACLAVVIGLQHSLTSRPIADGAAATAARVIEPERQILPDGSIVDLRHGAKITLAYSDERRVVILVKGEAHFSVTKNPQRPFIVETGTVKVSAVGTAFAVELGQTEVEVLVTEGRVSVEDTALASLDHSGLRQDDIAGISATAPTPLVEAGQRALVLLAATGSIPRIAAVPAVEMTEHLSWRLPRLEFSETSITEAMAMFNRYNQRKLRSTDLAVGRMRITGVFRSDSVEGFVRALESSGLGLQSEHREREILIRLVK